MQRTEDPGNEAVTTQWKREQIQYTAPRQMRATKPRFTENSYAKPMKAILGNPPLKSYFEEKMDVYSLDYKAGHRLGD